MKKSHFKSSFILSYTAIFIQSIISILYTPVLIRLLGQSSYGLLQLAISTVANLGILSFGFGSSYLRFYSEYNASDDNDAIAALNGMFAVIFMTASLAALILGGVITLFSDSFFSASLSVSEVGELKILLFIMTINLALTLPCNIFDSYIVSQESFTFQKLLIIFTSILGPVLTIPMLLLGGGCIAAAVCMVLVTLAKLFGGMIYCVKSLNMKFRFAFDKAVLKQLFVFSFFIFLNILSDQLNWNGDKTILGVIRGTDSVASYSIGSQLSSYFLTFSYALSTLYSPGAYKLIATGKDDKTVTEYFASFGRVQLIVMGYIYMILIAVGKPFIRRWTGIYSDTPYYTALLLITPLLVTSIQLIGIEIQRAKDMHRFRSVLYVLIAAANIIVSIPLCVKYGEIGCALGTCLSLTIGNVFIMNIYYHKRVGLDMVLFWREILKLIPSFLLPIAAVVISNRFCGNSLLSITLFALGVTAVYIPSVWFIGMNKDEKSLLKKVNT